MPSASKMTLGDDMPTSSSSITARMSLSKMISFPKSCAHKASTIKMVALRCRSRGVALRKPFKTTSPREGEGNGTAFKPSGEEELGPFRLRGQPQSLVISNHDGDAASTKATRPPKGSGTSAKTDRIMKALRHLSQKAGGTHQETRLDEASPMTATKRKFLAVTMRPELYEQAKAVAEARDARHRVGPPGCRRPNSNDFLNDVAIPLPER